MTTNHIDQLAEWYESAERITKTSLPGDGDFIIYPHRGGIGYIIERSEGGWTSEIVLPDEDCRILARAPKPKPAWHDAVAVIATYDDHVDQETFRGVWTPDGDGIWQHEDGVVAGADALTDVTPLIEAKVTDEAMQRVFNALDPSVNWRLSMTKEDEKYVRYILTAALGLGPA